MPDNHPGTSNYTVRLIKHKSAQMFARGALAVTLSAAMGTAMIPTQAIAEGLDAATTATEQKAAATDQAPTFDPKSVVYNAGEVSMTLDGKSEGTFSVFQVATSWVAGTPKQSADGAWTCTLTITPKDENKIAGHFGDSGYELDSANSKLTLTYTYNKWSGWHAFDKADHATVAYKKAEQAPTFDASQAANDSNAVKMLLDGVEQGGFSVSQVADSWTATEPKKDADGNWTVDLTFVPKDENKIAGHFGDSGYELDEANSKLTVTYEYNKNSGWHAFDKADRGTLAFKKAAVTPDKPSKPTQPTTPTNPTNPNNNGGKATGNNANNNAGNNAKVTPKAGATKANAAKAAATKAAASKASVPKTGDNNSLAGMATAGVLGAVSLLIAAVEKLHDLREQLR
ncbi:MAG: hypothetical protein LKF00_04855 [Olsenella sp.]|jgi:hypothetical protein|nr:hypothetical protein [Olsenella sp.]MCI1288735.1 hypothetical protein [Olsenella sp.]